MGTCDKTNTYIGLFARWEHKPISWHTVGLWKLLCSLKQVCELARGFIPCPLHIIMLPLVLCCHVAAPATDSNFPFDLVIPVNAGCERKRSCTTRWLVLHKWNSVLIKPLCSWRASCHWDEEAFWHSFPLFGLSLNRRHSQWWDSVVGWLLDSVGMAWSASIHVWAPMEQFNIAVYCIAKEFLTEPQNLFWLKLGFELRDMGVQKWEKRCDRGLKESESLICCGIRGRKSEQVLMFGKGWAVFGGWQW